MAHSKLHSKEYFPSQAFEPSPRRPASSDESVLQYAEEQHLAAAKGIALNANWNKQKDRATALRRIGARFVDHGGCLARNDLSGKRFRRPDDNASRGFALVLVIVVVLVASFLASQLIMLVRTELAVSHNIKSRVSGHFLAEAGLSLGLFRLLDRPLEVPPLGAEEDWEAFYEGYEYEVFLPKGKVTYYVASEGGKIDLNKSPQALLELFLEYQLGEDNEEAILTVVDSLLDWRDNDDLYRENGAESDYYDTLDDPYIARNGKIEDPADFFLIKGTRPMIGKFFAQEVFTVHSSDGKINFNSLTPAMLDFLTGGDKEKAVAYREAKIEFKGQLNAALASEILGDRFEKFQAYLTYGTGNSQYYFVVGTGYAGLEQGAPEQTLMEQGEEAKASKIPGTIDSMIIKKTGDGFTCLAWQERFT